MRPHQWRHQSSQISRRSNIDFFHLFSVFLLPIGFFPSICPSISNSIASAASCAFTSCPVGTEVNPSRDSSLACYSCPTGKYNVLNPDTGLTYSRCKFCKKGLRFVNAHSQCEGCIAGMYQAQNVSDTNFSWLIVLRQFREEVLMRVLIPFFFGCV